MTRMAKPSSSSFLANKLRLTSLALGNATHKELCGRFAEVNPGTVFTIENCYKWMRGKTEPRVSSVYGDWASVLGGGLTASFIAASTFDEFATAVQALYSVPDAALAKLREQSSDPLQVAIGPGGLTSHNNPWQTNRLLLGNYLAISLAWSRAEQDRLILGRATITQDESGNLLTRYQENLFGRSILSTGQMVCDGRLAQSPMICTSTGRLYFLGLQAPTPPANLIGGMLSGGALYDFEARIVAGRIALVRDHRSEDEPRHLQGYMDASPTLIDRELANLGYQTDERRRRAAERLLSFLREPAPSGLIEIRADALGQVTLAFDHLSVDEAEVEGLARDRR